MTINSPLPLGTIIRLAPWTDMQIKNCYTKREPVTCIVYAYKHVGYNDDYLGNVNNSSQVISYIHFSQNHCNSLPSFSNLPVGHLLAAVYRKILFIFLAYFIRAIHIREKIVLI